MENNNHVIVCDWCWFCKSMWWDDETGIVMVDCALGHNEDPLHIIECKDYRNMFK